MLQPADVDRRRIIVDVPSEQRCGIRQLQRRQCRRRIAELTIATTAQMAQKVRGLVGIRIRAPLVARGVLDMRRQRADGGSIEVCDRCADALVAARAGAMA